MKGKRLPRPKRGERAWAIVKHCIRMLTISAVWAMCLETVSAVFHVDIDLSDTLTFIGAVFGGELLMTLAKRLFAKNTEENTEEVTE